MALIFRIKKFYFVQTRVKTFYFVQVTDLIIKPNFVQSSSMSLKIILCTRLSLDIVHIKVKSTIHINVRADAKIVAFSSIRQTQIFPIDV